MNSTHNLSPPPGFILLLAEVQESKSAVKLKRVHLHVYLNEEVRHDNRGGSRQNED